MTYKKNGLVTVSWLGKLENLSSYLKETVSDRIIIQKEIVFYVSSWFLWKGVLHRDSALMSVNMWIIMQTVIHVMQNPLNQKRLFIFPYKCIQEAIKQS